MKEIDQYYLPREQLDYEKAYKFMKWKQFQKQEQQRRREQNILIKVEWLRMEGKRREKNVVPPEDPELERGYSETEYE